MPETVLITIDYNGQNADFELPAKLPIKMWINSLHAAMKMSFRGIHLDGKSIFLSVSGKKLPLDATFEEYGIFDGRKLQLLLEEM